MKTTTTRTSLIITFEGWEKVWALRNQIILPKGEIAGIVWHEQFDDGHYLWRIGGTGAPGMLYAGYFRQNGKTIFLYVQHPTGLFTLKAQNVLEITTDGGRFSRLLLTLDKASADDIRKWWRAK